MEWPRVRFSIRNLMFAVMVVAGLLALPAGPREFAAGLAISFLALLAALWLVATGRRALSGICFWTVAILANVLYAALSLVPSGYAPFRLFFVGWFFFLLPPLAGFGFAWVVLAPRESAAQLLKLLAASMSVVISTVMPLMTVLSLWPFHLAFLATRPTLGRLADRAAAGQAVAYPTWAGPFRIAGSAVDPASGNVALMIDPNPNGPTAFVREGRLIIPNPFGCGGPVLGTSLHIRLEGRWCYHEEE